MTDYDIPRSMTDHGIPRLNRRQRRAAKAAARGRRVDRRIAVHEAGHAVGRVLVAGLLGWDIGEIINSVEIRAASIDVGVSQDGLASLVSQATTYGPFLSKPMEDFLRARNAKLDIAAVTDAAVTEMRAAGIDVDGWLRAESLVCVFGPMAEATLVGRCYDDALGDYSSEADLADIVRSGDLCGKTRAETAEVINEAVGIAHHLMAEQPGVWPAILALADNLKFGRNDGREAAATIVKAMGSTGRCHS
jgi:hypothetical protein